MKKLKRIMLATSFVLAIAAAVAPKASAYIKTTDVSALNASCEPITCPNTGTAFCGYQQNHCQDAAYIINKPATP